MCIASSNLAGVSKLFWVSTLNKPYYVRVFLPSTHQKRGDSYLQGSRSYREPFFQDKPKTQIQ